jgi:hypothetical protein
MVREGYKLGNILEGYKGRFCAFSEVLRSPAVEKVANGKRVGGTSKTKK